MAKVLVVALVICCGRAWAEKEYKGTLILGAGIGETSILVTGIPAVKANGGIVLIGGAEKAEIQSIDGDTINIKNGLKNTWGPLTAVVLHPVYTPAASKSSSDKKEAAAGPPEKLKFVDSSASSAADAKSLKFLDSSVDGSSLEQKSGKVASSGSNGSGSSGFHLEIVPWILIGFLSIGIVCATVFGASGKKKKKKPSRSPTEREMNLRPPAQFQPEQDPLLLPAAPPTYQQLIPAAAMPTYQSQMVTGYTAGSGAVPSYSVAASQYMPYEGGMTYNAPPTTSVAYPPTASNVALPMTTYAPGSVFDARPPTAFY